MSNKSPKYEVGQELWYEPYEWKPGKSRAVKITKVGRKWLDLAGWPNMRADRDTLVIDGAGYSSPGRCYLSREARQAEIDLFAAWRALYVKMDRRNVPKGVTIESIGKAAELLGLGE